jgi:hypothetical protein
MGSDFFHCFYYIVIIFCILFAKLRLFFANIFLQTIKSNKCSQFFRKLLNLFFEIFLQQRSVFIILLRSFMVLQLSVKTVPLLVLGISLYKPRTHQCALGSSDFGPFLDFDYTSYRFEKLSKI